MSFAEETLEVQGNYHCSRFNPVTGTVLPGAQHKFAFVAKIWASGWQISCTNKGNPSLWEQLYWDGTNTYSLTPYAGHFTEVERGSNLVFGTVSPSPLYHSAVDNSGKVDLFVAWLSYGCVPHRLPVGSDGSLVAPLPWSVSRLSLGAYGYRWHVVPSDDRRFCQRIDFVRDVGLDLSDDEELLRPELDYPFTAADRDVYLETLADRRSVSNGFAAGRFECLDWIKLGSAKVPKRVLLKCYLGWAANHPYLVSELEATTVSVVNDAVSENFLPAGPAVVRDYRFKRMNDARIFKYAEYRLAPSENWKPANDPMLLREAEQHLARSRKLGVFGPSRIYVFGVGALSMLALLGIILLSVRKNGSKTKTK